MPNVDGIMSNAHADSRRLYGDKQLRGEQCAGKGSKGLNKCLRKKVRIGYGD